MSFSRHGDCSVEERVLTLAGEGVELSVITEPGSAPPDARGSEWATLMKAMRAVAGAQVIVLNHPRDSHSGFRPFEHVSAAVRAGLGSPA